LSSQMAFVKEVSPTKILYESMGDKHHALAILPLERIPGTHCTGVWVGLRASLDGCGEEKIPCPPLGFKPQIVLPITSCSLH
jgi:hypothetical protein